MSSKLYAIVSVDWEGLDLHRHNLERMMSLKRKFDIPLLHFLNPAYLTHPQICRNDVSNIFESILTQEDSIGLHLHAPKHLIQACGLDFVSGPTFSWHYQSTGAFQGQEVMLHSYSDTDLTQLINFSLEQLSAAHIKNVEGFRAGGWMADEDLLHTVQKCGLNYDSSASVSSLLNGTSWEGDNLQRYMDMLWPKVSMTTRPYFLETPNGPLLEVPNNLGAADYWTYDSIDWLSKLSVKEALSSGTHLVTLNSHQESAQATFDKLDYMCQSLSNRCQEANVDLEFISSPLTYLTRASLTHAQSHGH